MHALTSASASKGLILNMQTRSLAWQHQYYHRGLQKTMRGYPSPARSSVDMASPAHAAQVAAWMPLSCPLILLTTVNPARAALVLAWMPLSYSFIC